MMSKTEPLYLRLPADLKERVELEAARVEQSLSAVDSGLVAIGLRNTDEQLGALRAQIAKLEGEVSALAEARDFARADVESLREEVERNRAVIGSVLQRLRLPVGVCPVCRSSVSGMQVFVDGACANQHSLQASAIAPEAKSGLNQADLLAALAVVGVALGVAVAISKN